MEVMVTNRDITLNRESYEDTIFKNLKHICIKQWFEKAEKTATNILDYSDECLSKEQKIV